MQQRLFLLLAGLSFAACEDDTKAGMQTTELGNRYTYVTTNDDGQLANSGDYIYFQAQLKNEADSIVYDTRDAGGDPPVIQALSDTIVNENTGPVEDIVRKLRVGERAVIRTNISEYPPQAKPPGMQNDTVLLYDVEVTEIVDQEAFATRQEAIRAEQQAKADQVRGREQEVLDFTQQVYEDYKAGELDGQLQSTPGGVQYIVHEEGSGPEAEPGKGVVVQYVGRLASNGEIFDQSFERGMGIPFPLGTGRVIPGWDEGIDALQQGDRATLIIPSELGYGAQGTPNGSIPPDSELVFYVELEEVN
ncbi:FKBP-type peptidyl-prolyl cis-trans isomerase FkpA [Neolewinella xylanilytica]|uniref:Peptidyl-prolyl cis-trans isomerase n=1 Tax=Neolewinella xylanilytica TaxID=1514080 RepID=A0A2S6I593_9BACT|nr:FKBP-type peptidyl-prolyl cis-trans isomerase [Neolewinella xylanilytica]PPK86338.1 FKBP-type peptidyl-prolyl cis-trans isomerase FkpA [Neolewinella xylanilytica]